KPARRDIGVPRQHHLSARRRGCSSNERYGGAGRSDRGGLKDTAPGQPCCCHAASACSSGSFFDEPLAQILGQRCKRVLPVVFALVWADPLLRTERVKGYSNAPSGPRANSISQGPRRPFPHVVNRPGDNFGGARSRLPDRLSIPGKITARL